MGVIVYDDDIVPFEIEGERFDLKRRMSHGDRRVLEAEFLNLASQLQGKEVKVEAGIPLLLQLNVRGWSLRDRKGDPLELTPDNLNRLTEDVAIKLTNEINKRNPPPKVAISIPKSGPPSKTSSKKEKAR